MPFSDFDFSVPIEQYNAGIEDLLKNHKTIFLKYKFGKVLIAQ